MITCFGRPSLAACIVKSRRNAGVYTKDCANTRDRDGWICHKHSLQHYCHYIYWNGVAGGSKYCTAHPHTDIVHSHCICDSIKCHAVNMGIAIRNRRYQLGI